MGVGDEQVDMWKPSCSHDAPAQTLSALSFIVCSLETAPIFCKFRFIFFPLLRQLAKVHIHWNSALLTCVNMQWLTGLWLCTITIGNICPDYLSTKGQRPQSSNTCVADRRNWWFGWFLTSITELCISQEIIYTFVSMHSNISFRFSHLSAPNKCFFKLHSSQSTKLTGGPEGSTGPTLTRLSQDLQQNICVTEWNKLII